MTRYTNDFTGKKAMTRDLAEVYRRCSYMGVRDIELKKYRKDGRDAEFVLLTWTNGEVSTANNNANSLSATARNIARMLDGGVYENYEWYKEIMGSGEWIEVKDGE